MTPPLSIVIVGPSSGAPGGIAQFTQRLGEAMTTHGRIRVVSLARLYPGWTPPGRGSSGSTPTVPESITRATAWSPWTWRRARREIARNAPDLLVVQWWHPVFGPLMRSLLRSANRAGARSVVICHNASPHERFPFARGLTAMALREAGEIVTLSDVVAVEARRLAPQALLAELEHPPNLTVEPAPRRSPREGPASLLFFGNVRPYKGVGDLLDALPHVHAQIPVRLRVAGRFLGSMPQYRQQIRRLGIEHLVDLQDAYIPDEEVAPLFADADLLVMPYREASQSGLIALAAQARTPVVATAVGGLPQALGDDAILVPPRDRDALVAGIVRALRTPPSPPREPAMSWADFSAALIAGSVRTSAASA
jgi:glycosyltransferase involved in cell wall biosynthesis